MTIDHRLLEDHIRHVGYAKDLLFALDLEKDMDGVALYAVMKLGEEIDALVRCHGEDEQDVRRQIVSLLRARLYTG